MPVVRPPNLERAVEYYNSSEDDGSVENVVIDNANAIIAQEITLFRTGDRMAEKIQHERQWSILSNIITKNRNRIDHSVISDLMMAKENNDLLEAYEAHLVTNGN